jgi:hypothetical protein
MVEYAPIGDLVKQIPAQVWDVLQEVYARRPALMLGELLAVAKLKTLQESLETKRPEGRPLVTGPLHARRGA